MQVLASDLALQRSSFLCFFFFFFPHTQCTTVLASACIVGTHECTNWAGSLEWERSPSQRPHKSIRTEVETTSNAQRKDTWKVSAAEKLMMASWPTECQNSLCSAAPSTMGTEWDCKRLQTWYTPLSTPGSQTWKIPILEEVEQNFLSSQS